jgi:hypothetical protein
VSHPLDDKIMVCPLGHHETGLSARLRFYDHPLARRGWLVKHCAVCGSNTKPRKEGKTDGT